MVTKRIVAATERNTIDMVGKRFGRWLVIGRGEKPREDDDSGAYWLCRCDCSEERVVRGSRLRSGMSMSCGCLPSEINSNKRGDKNPNWNPSLTDDYREETRNYPEYHEWRIKVFERDNYTCQKCGKIGGDLNTHHIESYNSNKELRTTLENGVTLCADKCHSSFHHLYGYGNNTREQFNEFMLMENTDA